MFFKTATILASVCSVAADWSSGSWGGWNWNGEGSGGDWGNGAFPSCAQNCYSSAWSNTDGNWQSVASSYCATPSATSCLSSCASSDIASATSLSASLCSIYSSCSGSSTCTGSWGTFTGNPSSWLTDHSPFPTWPSTWNAEGWASWSSANAENWSPSGWTGPWTTMTSTATATIPAQWTTVSGISSIVQAGATSTTTIHITSAKDTSAAMVLTTSTISGTLLQGAAAAATGVPGAIVGVAGVMVGVMVVL